jgi:hypothetical protein
VRPQLLQTGVHALIERPPARAVLHLREHALERHLPAELPAIDAEHELQGARSRFAREAEAAPGERLEHGLRHAGHGRDALADRRQVVGSDSLLLGDVVNPDRALNGSERDHRLLLGRRVEDAPAGVELLSAMSVLQSGRIATTSIA